MTDNELREKILKNGVKNLREFGYPNCTTKNILTDEIYRAFFNSSLKDNLGHSDQIDRVINQLIKETN
jgi:hypothetical protein